MVSKSGKIAIAWIKSLILATKSESENRTYILIKGKIGNCEVNPYNCVNGFYNSNGLEGTTIDNPQTQLGAWSFLSHKITLLNQIQYHSKMIFYNREDGLITKLTFGESDVYKKYFKIHQIVQ